MSKVIHKHYLQHNTKVSIGMPIGSEVIKCELRGKTPCLWILRPDTGAATVRHFQIFGTGWEIPDNAKHIDTFMDDRFVWHVFELEDINAQDYPARG